MQIYDKLVEDMKSSMRSRDKVRLNTIRSLRAAIQRVQIDGGTRDETPSDEFVEQVLQKQAKMRREALEQYKSAGRTDLADIEEGELSIIASYLPEQIDDETIKAEIESIIATMGASSHADFGRVMGSSMKTLKGRADGKRVQAIVRELLTT